MVRGGPGEAGAQPKGSDRENADPAALVRATARGAAAGGPGRPISTSPALPEAPAAPRRRRLPGAGGGRAAARVPHPGPALSPGQSNFHPLPPARPPAAEPGRSAGAFLPLRRRPGLPRSPRARPYAGAVA